MLILFRCRSLCQHEFVTAMAIDKTHTITIAHSNSRTCIRPSAFSIVQNTFARTHTMLPYEIVDSVLSVFSVAEMIVLVHSAFVNDLAFRIHLS